MRVHTRVHTHTHTHTHTLRPKSKLTRLWSFVIDKHIHMMHIYTIHACTHNIQMTDQSTQSSMFSEHTLLQTLPFVLSFSLTCSLTLAWRVPVQLLD